MKASVKNRRIGNSRSTRTVRNTRSRLPAIAAVGSACTLAAGGASAVELGNVQIQSTLGQPLRASIAYALNPNEQISNHCIFLKSGTSADGMPLLSRARIQITDGAIILTGGAAIREPMLSMQLSISCPSTARLTREYTLMFNPAAPGDGEAIAALPVATAPRRAAPRPAARREPVARAAAPAPTATPASDAAPIRTSASPTVSASSSTQVAERSSARSSAETSSAPASATSPAAIAAAASNVDLLSVPTQSRYRVQPGDTLSEIVSRIDDRPPGLWRAVGHVFAANPQAFINGDMNLIKAGSWLDIPDLHAAAGVTAAPRASIVAEASTAADEPQAVAAETQEIAANGADSPNAINTGFATQPQSQPANPELASAPQPDLASNDARPEVLEPNTNALEPAIPRIPQPAETIRPADVAVGSDIPVSEAGTTGIAAATTPVVTSDLAAGDAGGRSWLFWLGGAGLALILGLLLFGRSMRARSGSSPSGLDEDDSYDSYSDDVDVGQQTTVTDFDATLIDESRMNRQLTLDADLGSGTGLQATQHVDGAEDFGYGADEAVHRADRGGAGAVPGSRDNSATDMVPLLRIDESMIVHRDVPPERNDADEHSMIVDIKTQNTGELLKGESGIGNVKMPDANSETGILQGLTLNEEVDLDALERDYEEEFTQTQQVNAEVARAAIEIAETLDSTGYRNEDLVDDVNDDILADDMSGLTAALTEVNLIGNPGEDKSDMTAAIPFELPAGDDMTDLTAAMPVEDLIAEELMEMTAVMPADSPIGEDLTDMTAALPAGMLLGEELTDMTSALPSLSELDLDLGSELPPTEMTSPTAILPGDGMPGETAELTAHLPEASSAVNDDNIGDLDATGIIEVPTAQMPSLEEDLTLEADLDAADIDDNKEKKAG